MASDEKISKREFIEKILEVSHAETLASGADNEAFDPVVYRAYRIGIADTIDVRDPRGVLLRSDAARLIHMYMKKILLLSDIPDISGAEELKDLYDCSACTAHIAAVYLRGIMGPKDMPGAGGRWFRVFDLNSPVSRTEAERIIERTVSLGGKA